MFEKLKRLLKSLTVLPEDEPESIDHPRPRRANHNPPQRDWFARVREKSLEAHDPTLSPEASRQLDELLAKAGAPPPRR